MVTILSTADSWQAVVRRLLGAFALVVLAPIAALPFAMLAFLLVPVAILGMPFLVVSFFGSANTEHRLAVQRASYHPPHAALPATA